MYRIEDILWHNFEISSKPKAINFKQTELHFQTKQIAKA